MLTNEYLKRVYEGLEKRNANEPEFLQAVREVLESIQPVVEKHPEYEKAGLIERLVVLFPAPFSPMIPTKEPFSISKSNPSNASFVVFG